MSPEEKNPLEDAMHNYRSKIGRRYKVEDVRVIWSTLSEWIAQQILSHKCLIIPQLGVFTISRWTLEAGIKRYILKQDPVFLMSEALCDNFNLYQPKVFTQEKVPVVHINFLQVGEMAKLKNRVMVEECITEIIQSLRRLVAREDDVRLDFPDLGVLRIVNKVVRFVWDTEFQKTFKKTEPPMRVKEPCQRLTAALVPYVPVNIYPCQYHKKEDKAKKKNGNADIGSKLIKQDG